MRFNWLSEYVASISSSIASTSPWRQLQQQVQQLVPNPQAIYCRIRSSSAEALEHVLIACAVYLLVCLGLYKLTFWLSESATASGPGAHNTSDSNNADSGEEDVLNPNPDGNPSPGGLKQALQSGLRLRSVRLPKTAHMERVLLITAHPDDECMFFGPLIYSLTQRQGCQVYILCLSNGELTSSDIILSPTIDLEPLGRITRFEISSESVLSFSASIWEQPFSRSHQLNPYNRTL